MYFNFKHLNLPKKNVNIFPLALIPTWGSFNFLKKNKKITFPHRQGLEYTDCVSCRGIKYPRQVDMLLRSINKKKKRYICNLNL